MGRFALHSHQPVVLGRDGEHGRGKQDRPPASAPPAAPAHLQQESASSEEQKIYRIGIMDPLSNKQMLFLTLEDLLRDP